MKVKGAGSITEKKNPKTGKSYTPKKWKCTISLGINKATGKYDRLQFYVQGSKADARKVINAKISELENGVSIDADKITFSVFMNEYIENRKANNELSTATISNYENYINHWIKPFLGDCIVKDIRPLTVEKWHREARKAGASGRTIQAAHKLAKMAFKKAVRDGLALSNPFDLVETPKAESKKRGYLEPSEVGRMLSILSSEEKTGFNTAIILGLATGARRGEVLGLTWENVDLQNGTIRIVQSLVQVDGARKNGVSAKKIKAPKTESGKRSISLDPFTLEWLTEWKRQQKDELKGLKVIQTQKTPVCCSLYDSKFNGVAVFAGGMLDPQTFSSQFHRFCSEHGFYSTTGKVLCFHELRHTQATFLLSHGEDVISVSARMGHASPSITSDMYAHAMPERDKECAAVIGEIFERVKTA